MEDEIEIAKGNSAGIIVKAHDFTELTTASDTFCGYIRRSTISIIERNDEKFFFIIITVIS